MESILMLSGPKKHVGDSGPGSDVLLKGDETHGYFGRVPVSALANGIELAAGVGLTTGTVLSDGTNSDWIKFSIDSKILFVQLRGFRHTISWPQLNAVGIVYGDKTYTTKGWVFKVRLIKGDIVDPISRVAAGSAINDLTPSINERTEWGKTMSKILDGTFDSISVSETGLDKMTGGATWCQETQSGSPTYHLVRGATGLPNWYGTRNDALNFRLWRPVLELVGRA